MAESGGYAHPELLAETDWLQQHLGDPAIVVVDCDSRDAYRRAHIPGAISLTHPILPEPQNYLKDPDNPTYVLPPDKFARVMADLGIGDETLVVAYDGGAVVAARLWWCLSYYGHTNVKVLNGGWPKWLREGRPITNADARPKAGATFTPKANPELITTAEGIMACMARPDVAILDVRTDGEWTGREGRANKRAGHIPDAVHLEWVNYVGEDRSTFKPAAELRQLFEQAGIHPEQEVLIH